jgi:hypothetical protein
MMFQVENAYVELYAIYPESNADGGLLPEQVPAGRTSNGDTNDQDIWPSSRQRWRAGPWLLVIDRPASWHVFSISRYNTILRHA